MKQPTLFFEERYNVSIEDFDTTTQIDEFIENREGVDLKNKTDDNSITVSIIWAILTIFAVIVFILSLKSIFDENTLGSAIGLIVLLTILAIITIFNSTTLEEH